MCTASRRMRRPRYRRSDLYCRASRGAARSGGAVTSGSRPISRTRAIVATLALTALAVSAAYQTVRPFSLRIGSLADAPFLGGFYPREFRTPGSLEKGFRWTTGAAAIDLTGLGGNLRYRMTLTLSAWRPIRASVPVLAACGGERLASSASDRPVSITLDCAVPPGWSGGPRVLLRTGPFTPGRGDTRALGLVIERVEVVPLRAKVPVVVPPLREVTWAALAMVLLLLAAELAGLAPGAALAALTPIVALVAIGYAVARLRMVPLAPWLILMAALACAFAVVGRRVFTGLRRFWTELSPAVRAALAVILAVALALRLWSIRAGIPFAVGVDEPELVDRALHMLQIRDLNPHFFDYPGLYIYAQMALAGICLLCEAVRGLWPGVAQLAVEPVYLGGRVMTALFGTATVAILFPVGRRFGGPSVGLAAAAILAVLSPHVRESHYVLTDVPMTFFVVLSFWWALRAADDREMRPLAFAAVAAGLAAAVKYNGGLAVLPVLVAAFDPWQPRETIRRVLWACGLGGAAFLAGAPYTLLDFSGFRQGFGHLASVYSATAPPAESPWVLYLKYLIAAGAVLLTAGTLGFVTIATGALRAPRRTLLLVIFPLAYFGLIASRPLVFGRYLMPLYPFLALYAALGVRAVVDRLTPTGAVAPPAFVALALIVLAGPTWSSILWDRVNARPGTSTVAYEWILANVPPGTRLVLEQPGLVVPQLRYHALYVPPAKLLPPPRYAQAGYGYLVVREDHLHPAARANGMVAFEARPSDEHPGPAIVILRLRAP